MPERVFFEAGDPEYEDEKPDMSDIQIKRGRKLIRVGLLILVLGLFMCLFFIILVVAVVPASLSSSAKDGMNHDQVTIVKDYFGKTTEGLIIERYKMTNEHKMVVQVITFGARVTSLLVPDRHGKTVDVILGCDNVADCATSHLGGVLGRVSNGIAGLSFILNGVVYNVSSSIGAWDKRLWVARVETDRVVMSLRSADSEHGFPGEVEVNVTYQLTNDNKLKITYAAKTKQKSTPINLSSRLYFNLAGEGSGTISNHSVAVFANSYLPTDANHIPTGDILSVSGTENDLRSDVRIGSKITKSLDSSGSGINTTYCLHGPTGSRLAARVRDADSGRVLTVFTDQPAVRFYTGNHLNFTGKSGHHYYPHSGFLLETQNYPDAIHHLNFPDSVLTEGSLYIHEVIFSFTTEL